MNNTYIIRKNNAYVKYNTFINQKKIILFIIQIIYYDTDFLQQKNNTNFHV